ncbi:4'-phosphopantetheinyl transferase family protein [Mycobacterium sp. Marseille-P9652]|uniref:4'-phosphopantetheinyl transferase family protein n=1 Tax=Mycobacterium sp. Marseille-P9652 TaxID=2654950 RepID=UPI0012E81ABD|nr:4'-phosphopantetheinyl transferase superfamily protein [Mycobacterium sp. Marseille-P9652]
MAISARGNRPEVTAGTLRWLALGADAMPPDERWLAPGEAAIAARLRYTKRRNEFLLRRLVAKHAVALATGRPTDAETLAGIEVRNAESGAPYVSVALELSISDRAGWAVCVVAGADPVGCDLELVEPRSPGFVSDFLTATERGLVDSCAPGDERDAMANLLWSAKESALKALGTGLDRDTHTLDVTPGAPRDDGWGALTVRAVEGDTEGTVLPGWWRREGRFVLTVVTRVPTPAPAALGAPGVLARALPRHTWLERPLLS